MFYLDAKSKEITKIAIYLLFILKEDFIMSSLFQRPFNNHTNVQSNDELPMNQEDTIQDDIGINALRWASEKHVACVFLLDTSGSMSNNDAIGKLNEGLRIFKEQTVNDSRFDEHTKACIDVAIISFGPTVKVIQDFMPVNEMTPPTLTANGGTPMGGALNMALDMITQQKEKYNFNGTPYFRPWVICITDGEPNDSYQAAAQRLKQMEDNKKVLGYCVGVENFNKNIITNIFNSNRIFELDNLNFPALFEFFSGSLSVVRNSDANGSSVEVEVSKDIHKISLEY